MSSCALFAVGKGAGGIILLHANSGMKHWEEAGFRPGKSLPRSILGRTKSQLSLDVPSIARIV
jgi:hypothetical protein